MSKTINSNYEYIYNLPNLRYETVIEQFQTIYDKSLSLMNYYDIHQEPNLIHYFLATTLEKGNIIITTNYDYMIERAILKLYSQELLNSFKIIITEKNFQDFLENYEVLKGVLIKLHGAKRNLLTNENTSDTQITTVTSLGESLKSDRKLGLVRYKKDALRFSVENRILVVIGYSGNDDLDITPELLELKNIKQIIWIDYIKEKNVDLSQFLLNKEKLEKIGINNLNSAQKLLYNLSLNNQIPIYYLQANILSWIQTELWSYFYPEKNQPLIAKFEKSETPFDSYLAWFIKNNSNMQMTDLQAYSFAIFLYLAFGGSPRLIKCIQIVLSIIDKSPVKVDKTNILGVLGLAYMRDQQFSRAIEVFKEALHTNNEKDLRFQANIYNNLGEAYRYQEKNQIANDYYQKAIEIGRNLGDARILMFALNNSGINDLYSNNIIDAYTKIKESLNYAKDLGNIYEYALRLRNLGEILISARELDDSLAYLKESLPIMESLGNVEECAKIFQLLFCNYFLKKQEHNAQTAYERCVYFCNQIKNPKRVEEIFEIIELFKKKFG